MSRPFNIACMQTRPMPDINGALTEAMPMVEAAARAGAQMLFLPEYCGGLASDGVRFCPPAAPEDQHPMLAALPGCAVNAALVVLMRSSIRFLPTISSARPKNAPGGRIASRKPS